MNPKILLTAGGMLAVSGQNHFRKQVLRFGRWVHPSDASQFFEVTPELVNRMVANFKAKVAGDVPVMLGEHNSGPEHNKGMVVDLIPGVDGLYADVEFRDTLTQELANKNLIPGVSVKVDPDYKDHANNNVSVGPAVVHMAIVQEPYIKNLRGWEPVPAAQLSDSTTKEVLYFSEDKPVMTKEELIAELKKHSIDVAALQVESAKVPTITAEFSDYKTKHPVVPPAVPLPTEIEKDPKFISLSETVTSISAKLNEANTKLADQQKVAAKAEAERKVTILLSEGKIVPADKPIYVEMAENNPAVFDKIVPTLKATVDLSEKGTSFAPGGVNKSLDPTEAQGHVDRYAKMMGAKK